MKLGTQFTVGRRFLIRWQNWLVGAGLYAMLLTFGLRLLNDPDSYSHIAVGRWIVAHGAVPASDPFSFSMHGAPWIPFEWLSEVIYAAVYALSGWAGVMVLAASSIALAVGLLTRFLLRELAPTLALLMVIAAVMLAAPHMLARPHVLTLPIMVAWAAALVRCGACEGWSARLAMAGSVPDPPAGARDVGGTVFKKQLGRHVDAVVCSARAQPVAWTDLWPPTGPLLRKLEIR